MLNTHEKFKDNTHIYDFKRTGEKDIFAVGTYKGLFILSIDSKTLGIAQISKFFNEPGIFNEIRSLAFVENTYLLLSFIKDTKLYLFNYKTGHLNYHF